MDTISEKDKSVPSNRIGISKNELLKMNEVDLSAGAAEFSKYSFRYYTTISTLINILGKDKDKHKHYFYVSSFADMNDVDEANMHADKASVFALCFSNSDSESIPMWYLYSGLLGKGASIRLTAGLMLEFLRSVRVVYPVKNNDPDLNAPLTLGKDFELLAGWVYYFDKARDLFFKNKWYRVSDDADGFFADNYFLKKYPWFYEREFRLVFRLKSENGVERIAVPIDDTIFRSKKTGIVLAPEVTEHELSRSFPAWFDIQKSDLEISMNLLKRNRDEIYEYIKQALDQYNKK